MAGDDALIAQNPKALIGGDRVVDARPRLPVKLGHAGADAEHRGLIGMPRNPGRRSTRGDHLDVGVRPHERFALICDPAAAGTGLAVWKGEHHVAEELRAGPQRGVGRVGREASDKEQLAIDATGHLWASAEHGLGRRRS